MLEFLNLKPSHEVNTWITANTRKQRSKRTLNINDFRLDEEINYEDKTVMIYKDGNGHSYNRTKFKKDEPLQFEQSPPKPEKGSHSTCILV